MKLEDGEAKDEGSRSDRHLEPIRDLATRLDRLDFITLKLGIAAFGKHGEERERALFALLSFVLTRKMRNAKRVFGIGYKG